MRRYLIYYSYLGTRFRGVQKQFKNGIPVHETETIQSILELGLKCLKQKPLNIPLIYPASRTDQGVHALCTAAHVDLEFENDIIPVYHIIRNLNTFFTKRNYDIRILNVRVVPESFSARYSAVKKRYLYRFAVLKPDILPDIPNKKQLLPFPIIEKDRCHFVFNPIFDVNVVKKTAGLFIGFKDFRAFMGRNRAKFDIVTERSIESLEIKQGCPLFPSTESEYYDFWEITCSGRSFLYKQVRRIVGVLLAVGQGHLGTEDVQLMLNNPAENPWKEIAVVVPGYGLYLTNVEYSEEDLLGNLIHTSTTITLEDGSVYLQEIKNGKECRTKLSSGHGYVVDTQPDLQVAQILPGLFFGSQDPAKDEELLLSYNITHVLSIGLQVDHAQHSPITYNYVQAYDIPEFDIISIFEYCFAFIDSVLETKGSVYVHCNAGVSRCPTIILAYLIKQHEYSFENAYIKLKEIRPSISPNPGFINQLRIYEKLIHNV